jgi:hypothetical protein
MPTRKRKMAPGSGQPGQGAGVQGGAQAAASSCETDACRCDGCVNSNYPRSRAVILAELTAAAREHGCLWVLEFVVPQQLEMFR